MLLRDLRSPIIHLIDSPLNKMANILQGTFLMHFLDWKSLYFDEYFTEHKWSLESKSALVQVMAWCHQAPSHYLNQWWPKSMLPFRTTWPQWVISNSNLFLSFLWSAMEFHDWDPSINITSTINFQANGIHSIKLTGSSIRTVRYC